MVSMAKRKAFTLVEILIVAAILGIMAAIVMPLFAGHVQQAKESAAKDNLRVLRGVMGAYAGQTNDVPPGYAGGNPDPPVVFEAFAGQIKTGNYLKKIPKNPLNTKKIILPSANTGTTPPAPGDYGWFIRLKQKL